MPSSRKFTFLLLGIIPTLLPPTTTYTESWYVVDRGILCLIYFQAGGRFHCPEGGGTAIAHGSDPLKRWLFWHIGILPLVCSILRQKANKLARACLFFSGKLLVRNAYGAQATDACEDDTLLRTTAKKNLCDAACQMRQFAQSSFRKKLAHFKKKCRSSSRGDIFAGL